MDDPWLIGLMLGLGALLYSSVGHGGASAYIAILTLMGSPPELIRSLALGLNVVVATVGSINYQRAGAFSWQLFWPFALTSIPMALVGSWLAPCFGSVLKVVLGMVLLFAAIRMVIPSPIAGKSKENPPLPSRWFSIACGSIIGFLSGLTGVGGGIFLSPLLVMGGWATPKGASAVSAPFIVVNSAAALAGLPPSIEQLAMPTLLWAGFVLVGGWIGSYLGSRHFNPVWLKRMLGLVLLVAAGKMLIGWVNN